MTWGEILEDLKDCPPEAEVQFLLYYNSLTFVRLDYTGGYVSRGRKIEAKLSFEEEK